MQNQPNDLKFQSVLKTITEKSIAVLFGIDGNEKDKIQKFQGALGHLDWLLHGQVSALVISDHAPVGQTILVGANAKKNLPHFLGFHFSTKDQITSFVNSVKRLQISSVSVLSATFPKDILEKLKQNLTSSGVGFTLLE